MGFFKKIFGGNRSDLPEIISKTKAFIDPQIKALEDENLQLVFTARSVTYMIHITTGMAGRRLEDDLRIVMNAISENDEFKKALDIILCNTSSEIFTDKIVFEMQEQARNDLINGYNRFLIDHTKEGLKRRDAMFEDDYTPPKNTGKSGDLILGSY